VIDCDVGVFRGNSRVTDGDVGVLEVTAELERAASAVLE
jgi:hypothetical protein